MHKINKLLIILSIFILIFILYVVIVQHGKYIDVKYKSTFWINNSPEIETQDVSVIFHGTLTSERFSGNISIYNLSNDEDITLNNVDVILSNGLGLIRYGEINSDAKIPAFGMLLCDNSLSKFSIFIYDDDDSLWDSYTSAIITGPAKNRAEALNITQELSLKHQWLEPARWQ